MDADEIPSAVTRDPQQQARIVRRLERSAQLSLFLDQLSGSGIWTTTIFEPTYPRTLLRRLAEKAPPYLFGFGHPELAEHPTVGFAGSRDVSDELLSKTSSFAERAAKNDIAVVTGGAKGVDRASMDGALSAGGQAVVYPAEGLKSFIKRKGNRSAAVDGQLLALSGYRPEAGWSVGMAMGRNRYIHGHADAMVIMSSGNETGGTWAGATENLKHRWSPLHVWAGKATPPGNKALLDLGADALEEDHGFSQILGTVSSDRPAAAADVSEEHLDAVLTAAMDGTTVYDLMVHLDLRRDQVLPAIEGLIRRGQLERGQALGEYRGRQAGSEPCQASLDDLL